MFLLKTKINIFALNKFLYLLLKHFLKLTHISHIQGDISCNKSTLYCSIKETSTVKELTVGHIFTRSEFNLLRRF